MVMMRWRNNTKLPELLLEPVLTLILGSKRKSAIDILAYILIYIEYIRSKKHCFGLKCGYKTFETCTHQYLGMTNLGVATIVLKIVLD